MLARELYPGARYRPTASHVFLALLARKGLLHMLFTQNIDCLERAAGIPPEKIIEAHGSFATQRCIDCKVAFDGEKMKEFVARGEVPRCEEEGCGGLVKPDIVFFGEALPRDFFDQMERVREADLVLVMGTSLQVHPFAGLPDIADKAAPRVLFNREEVGSFGTRADDVMVLGDCDAGVRKLADALGWRQELEEAWRALVGEDEAERQLQGATKRVAEVQDEVGKLAEEVEEVLHIGDGESKKPGVEKKEVVEDGPQDESPPAVPVSVADVKVDGEAQAPKPDVAAQPRFGDGAGPPLTDGKVEQGEQVNKGEESNAGAASL